MSTIVIQRFANREIRIGCQNIAANPKNYGDKKEDAERERFSNATHDLYVSSQNVIGGYELGKDRRGCAIAIPYSQEQHDRVKARLDIISEFQQKSNQPKKKGGWGFKTRKTSFGRNARHRILEAGAVMDKFYKNNVVEVTLTVPGNTGEIFRTVANWSGWIMNRLTQVVRRFDEDTGWFYVWENQLRGALHLHFAIGSSTLPDALELAERIKCKWFKCLLELEEKSNVDVFKTSHGWTWRYKPEKWQFHILPVYKSVAAYFSKYCGKQPGKDGGNNKGFCPARWWGSSRSIKREIDAQRKSFSIEVCTKNEGMAISFCSEILSQFNPIRQYSYDFHLGQSAKGAELGSGWRKISYFDDPDFEQASELIDGMADFVAQTWGIYAHIPDLSMQTSKYKLTIGKQT